MAVLLGITKFFYNSMKIKGLSFTAHEVHALKKALTKKNFLTFKTQAQRCSTYHKCVILTHSVLLVLRFCDINLKTYINVRTRNKEINTKHL